MHDLEAGRYWLMVDVPADGPAVEVEPVALGIEAPGRGPPPEVLRRYLEMAGLKQDAGQ
jgi:hypothetical protein